MHHSQYVDLLSFYQINFKRYGVGKNKGRFRHGLLGFCCGDLLIGFAVYCFQIVCKIEFGSKVEYWVYILRLHLTYELKAILVYTIYNSCLFWHKQIKTIQSRNLS